VEPIVAAARAMSDAAPMSEAARRTHALVSAAGVVAAFALLGALIAAWGWTGAFRRLGVPTLSPPLADVRPLQAALAAEARGLDPRIDNPDDPWRRPLDYPDVWLRFARALDLGNERHLRAFAAVGEIGFVVMLVMVAALAPTLWLSLGAFSGATWLLLERGNNDAYLFVLVALVGLVASDAIAAALLLLATWLKVYPLFALGRLAHKRIALWAFALLAGAYLTLHAHELWRLRAAIQTGVFYSYGAEPLAAWLRIRTGADLPPFVVGVGHLGAAALLWLALGDRLAAAHDPNADRARRLFLVGGGIYAGSFLASSNWDYRLVFLLLCLPHISRLKQRGVGIALALTTLAALHGIALKRVLGGTGAVLEIGAKSLAYVGVTALLLGELARSWRTRVTARNLPSAVAS
jgi:hypothetical protein